MLGRSEQCFSQDTSLKSDSPPLHKRIRCWLRRKELLMKKIHVLLLISTAVWRSCRKDGTLNRL